MSDIRAVKRNISMQHWAAIIADRNTTDLTVKEYCTRNNLSRNSYFYWLRQLRQEATDSLDLKSLTKNTVRQEENCIVELVPSGKRMQPIHRVKTTCGYITRRERTIPRKFTSMITTTVRVQRR